jgi:pyruvate dehydrogenase E2 component (dihydrolipoamide acetyltransferase)
MAQLTLGHEADVTALVAVRAALKAENAAAGRRTPTITDFIVKAAALALREHPTMNSALVDGRIESPGRIDVGVAVAIDDGLLVPVVRNADGRSVGEISTEAARLAAASRTGKLSLPELEGATFVVSSLGTAGIDFFTPIVNPGNAGILGVGRIRDGVRWEGETPKRTDVMTLSLTFDHRVIDGAPAANYLLAVAERLARPLSLLAG